MNESIKQQLDACRPGQADMLSAEMDALHDWLELSDENQLIAESVERFDQAIVNVVEDVDVPLGHAERIKAALLQDEQRNSTTTSELAGAIAADGTLTQKENAALGEFFVELSDDELVQRDSALKNRRVILGLAVLASLAAMLMLAIGLSGLFNPAATQTIAADELGRQALDWDPFTEPGNWNRDFDSIARNYPLSEKLNVTPVQWKTIATKYDDSAVVVDMSPAGGAQVYLYVIRSRHQFQVSSQFDDPIYDAGGFCVGAYQSGDLLYVVVVEGDLNRYRRVIKSSLEVV